MQTSGLSGIILYVADMQAQVEFYRDTMGLKLAHPVELPNYAE